MTWTGDRVDLLKKLWADGLSASQISCRLGGVTRNAVIGKVHRLGLAGRARTSHCRSPRPRNRVSHLPIRPTRVQYRTNGNAALKLAFIPVEQPAVALTVVPCVVQELNIPPALRVDLLDLRSCMCRWPIGDPQEANFHFCGRNKAPGFSYCDFHLRLAFQPARRR